jgi:hypothetical protein
LLQSKFAPTDVLPIMGTVQVGDVPLQAPVHPRNLGLLVTPPLPPTVKLSVYCWVGGTNVEVTDRAAAIVVLQAPVPVQSPLHPVKTLPLVGVAANEIAVS